MEAFAALVYKPEQVTKILLTHRHNDHSGELRSFPNAKIYVNKDEMDLDHPMPTVLAEVDFSKQQASGKYVCSICGYVYDPAEHDGVAFEDLPDDWKCPRCKQGKEKFNKA